MSLRRRGRRGKDWPLWLAPVLIVGLAVIAAELAPRLDDQLPSHILPSISSRLSSSVVTSVLTAVASGMIAFTGFVFTIVLLAVQFGTSNFSARLVPFFQQDRVIRIALGVFTATFVYCVIAATVIAPGGHTQPLVTVLVAQLLALASVFLFFALMTRVGTLLRAVGLLRVVGRLGRRTPQGPAGRAPRCGADHKGRSRVRLARTRRRGGQSASAGQPRSDNSRPSARYIEDLLRALAVRHLGQSEMSTRTATLG